MEKAIEILLKSIKVSTENLQYIVEETTGTNGMLLNSVIETLKAQTLVIKTISCKLDAEKPCLRFYLWQRFSQRI